MFVRAIVHVDDLADSVCVPCGHTSEKHESYTAEEIARLQHVHGATPKHTPSLVMTQGFGTPSPQSTAPITTISY